MSMRQRSTDDTDLRGRLTDIECMVEAAIRLVEAEEYVLAEQVLIKIGQRATNG